MTGEKWDIGASNARQSEFMHKHQDEPNVSGPEDEECYCKSCERIRWEFCAVRSFHRLYAIRTEGWHEGEMCDRHFDGGEWSGPAWAKNYEEEHMRTVKHIAERFGVDEEKLHEWIENMQYYESNKWQDAMMKRGDDHIRTMCGFDPALEEKR